MSEKRSSSKLDDMHTGSPVALPSAEESHPDYSAAVPKLKRFIQTRSVGFIIIASCTCIVLILMFGILITTFFSFQRSTGEALHVQTRELGAQIVYNYEYYINSIIEISNTIQTDISEYDVRYDSDEFSAYLGRITHLKGDIIKIAVYDHTSGACLASSRIDDVYSISEERDNQWFYGAISDPTIHFFSVPYADGGEYKVNISKQIEIQGDDQPAVLKIEISFQNFIDLVERSNLGKGGHITIIDPDYAVVYTSLPAAGDQDVSEVIRQIILGSRNVMINGYNMAVNIDTLSNTKWRICVFINIDRINDIQRNFLLTTLIVSAGILFAGFLLFTLASHLITNPIKQLERAMRKVEKADYFRTEKVELVASKEVDSLVLRFNKMMMKISELMERVVHEQDAQRKSELKALQNQINPHFLYNTLDSIIWLVENNKNKDAGEMVVALARLFRLSISKDKEVIPVRDEIEHVRNYLLIQNLRYKDSFHYRFEVENEVLDLYTMKLILQPLVENCIYHGLKNRIEYGEIVISAGRDENDLVFSVSDNGYGIRQSNIDELFRSFQDGVVSDGVGLKNIYQRVMMYYGGKAQMTITSELDEGTTITIREPIH